MPSISAAWVTEISRRVMQVSTPHMAAEVGRGYFGLLLAFRLRSAMTNSLDMLASPPTTSSGSSALLQ